MTRYSHLSWGGRETITPTPLKGGRKSGFVKKTSAPDLMHSRGFGKVSDPATAALKDLIKNVGDFCIYTYDLGDGWYHLIELEEIISANESNGACQVLGGAMRCPDEDGEGCHTL